MKSFPKGRKDISQIINFNEINQMCHRRR